jgi:RecA-family ATPase
MNDKIKTIYNDMVENITPDKQFLDSLVDVLEKEETTAKKRRADIHVIRRIVSAAACVVIVAGTAVFAVSQHQKSGFGVTVRQGESSSPVLTGRFDEQEKPGLLKEEYIAMLYDRLVSDSKAYIYVNNENVFTDEQYASEAEKENILNILKNGSSVLRTEKKNKKYYMAVFSDGKILKFNISDESYMEIPSEEIFLTIEKSS